MTETEVRLAWRSGTMGGQPGQTGVAAAAQSAPAKVAGQPADASAAGQLRALLVNEGLLTVQMR